MTAPAAPAAPGVNAAANRRCPRCGRPFRCGIDDPAPCACTGVTLDADTLVWLRTAFSGCLCVDCLRELAAAGPQPRRTSPSSAASGSTERGR